MDLLCFFSGLCLLCFCAVLSVPSVYMCLVVTCGKGLPSWLSFVASNYGFVTFPLVSWVRCGIVRPANRDWACQSERCHTLSNKISLQ